MTIRDSLYFIYDGIESKRFNIANVTLDGGMQEEYFASSRSIVEDKTRGRSKPNFQRIEREPLTLSVSFAFEDTWDERTIQEVRRWLTETDYYKPLIFSNHPEKIYYALCTDNPVLIHNGLKQGYMNLTFRCNDAYAYSPLSLSKVYDWDETVVTVSENSFSAGHNHGLALDGNQHLTLQSSFNKWENLSPSVTWQDI